MEKGKKWRTSVLTPVHGTPLPLLERVFRSLKAQSFGFPRIQWVLVLHNCDEAYRREVFRLCHGYPNICIFRAEAEDTGVSYARNVTLALAEGEYIFFLDADDEMKPACIEVVVGEMEGSKADTAIFTADLKGMGKLWTDAAPAEGILTLERGDPRIGRSMCFSGMLLWARCYRRDFLAREGIFFNEGFPYGEDYLFNVQATGTARRVCVLPDFCGYAHYPGIGMTKGIKDYDGDPGLFASRLYRYGRACGLELANAIWYWASLVVSAYLFSDVPAGSKKKVAKSLRTIVETLPSPSLECKAFQEEMDAKYRFVLSSLALYC